MIAVLPVAVEFFLYRRKPEDMRLKYVIGVMYSLFYVFVVFTTVSMVAFTYIIPLYMVLVLYSDVKLCAWVSGFGLVSNLVFLGWQGAMGAMDGADMASYEIRVALLVGVILGALNYIRLMLMYPGQPLVCLTVVLSLYITIIMAKGIGCTLPIAAKLLNLDPAIMAAPLISTIVDACSLIIYFRIACNLLSI